MKLLEEICTENTRTL